MDKKKEIIFIWDLDETLIIYKSLLDSSFAIRYNKNIKVCQNVGLEIERIIFDIADQRLFFKDLEDHNIINVTAISKKEKGGDGAEDAIIRDHYTTLAEVYNFFGRRGKPPLCSQNRLIYSKLISDLNVITESWTSVAMKSLSEIEDRPYFMNVLVTTTQLVPALAKLLFYGLGEIFGAENVYSATDVGKKQCFEEIKERFGPSYSYIAIGDGKEEEEAARNLQIAFWKVRSHHDLVQIYRAIYSGEIAEYVTNSRHSDAS